MAESQSTTKRGGVYGTKFHERALIFLVNNGAWKIDGQGRIWVVRQRKTGGQRFVEVDRKRAERRLKSGYLRVRAGCDGLRRGCLAHRLVWQSFFGDIPFGMTVNHKNGKKADNRPGNLELATQQDNCLHAAATGLRTQVGETHSFVKLSDEKIAEMRAAYSTGNIDQPRLAEIFGVCALYVGKVVRGEWRRTAGGPITKKGRCGRTRVNPRVPRFGQEGSNAKISDRQVVEIRESADGAEELAARFDVHITSIYAILRGESRRSAGGPIREVKKKQKLSPNDVREIRRRHAKGESQASLSRLFGVAAPVICNTVNGKSHKSVT